MKQSENTHELIECFEESQGGIRVTFYKDLYNEEQLKKLNINERQVKAILHIRSKGQITNAEYQQINTIGKSLAAAELQDLVNRNLLSRVGITGRGTKYTLPNR